MQLSAKTIAPCLWFDTQAEDAAKFYVSVFKNSKITSISRFPDAGQDVHGKPAGSVMVVAFELDGQAFTALNGGPQFKHSEAFSFQIATDNQEETDRYWSAIVGNGGKESQCGWCRDRWGLSWQITPRVLMDALAAGGAEAKRAFSAMMSMTKIDVAKIEAARRG